MCKVTKYRYTCGHSFAVQSSKCGGTKHEHISSREGPSPFCKSPDYLHHDIKLSEQCGPCKYAAVVAEVEANNPVPTAASDRQLWNARKRYPTYKISNVKRVGLGRFEKKPSPLRREVQPHEIPHRPAVVVSTVGSSKWD